jgi:thiol peroxidase
MAQITLGGNPIQTSGELPAVQSQAPEFQLTNTDLEDFQLGTYKGKKILLNIFPSVDTGVCAASIRSFNQRAADLDNTVVLCISMDLPFAQQRFCGAEGIENVVMASGFRNEGKFAQDYGVNINDGGFAGLYARAVVVIDESGKVVYTELVPEIGQEPNYEQALAAL